jgi:hypothetical protein
MKNSAATEVAAVDSNWSDIINGATLVGTYTFNTTNNFPGAEGFLSFVLDANFDYTGGSLEIAVDWDCSNLVPVDPMIPTELFSGNGSLNWHWTATTQQSLIYDIGSSSAPDILDAASRRKAERVNTQLVYGAAPPPASGLVTLPHYEGFDYADDAQLTSGSGNQGDWLATYTSDGSDPYVIDSPTWSLPTGLPAQTGRAIEFQGGSEDPVLTFEPQGDSGFVYSSFVFNVTTQEDVTDSNGGYIYSFGKINSGMNGFNYASTVYLKKIDDNTFNIGVGETNSTSRAEFAPTAYSIGTDYFIVISYDIANEISNIWINPTSVSASTEPTPDISTTDTTTGSRDDIVVVRLSLESNSRTPETILDEIRIGNTWAEVVANPGLGVVENELASNLRVYPNPASDFITIQSNNVEISSVKFYDILGKNVLSQNRLTNNRLDVSSLKSGVYFMKINSNANTITKKIIIE